MAKNPDAGRMQVEHSFMTNEKFARKIIALRKEAGLSQRDLANKIEVSVNTLQSYERGQIPHGPHLIALARSLKCSIDWLVGLTDAFSGIERTSGSIDDPRPHMLIAPPLLTMQDNEAAHAESDPSLVFDSHWLNNISPNPSLVSFFTVHGPAMNPTLLDGDQVLVDQGKTTVHQGSVYVLTYDDRIVVNRLETRPGGILRVISDNRDIAPPYEIESKQVRILGEIIWLNRLLY